MRIKIYLLLALCAAFFAPSCSKESTETAAAPQKPLLLVSIPPYRSLVHDIAGDSFEVHTVVPPNADPHIYEPTSRQLSQISRGALWFRIGEPFEQKMLPLLPSTESYDLRQGISLLEGHKGCSHHHAQEDRHFWLSPKSMKAQAASIAKKMEEHFPEHSDEFRKRLAVVEEKLDAIDREIQNRLDHTTARSFLVSHPAFAYFCHDYDCEQFSVEQEGKEPKPKELEQLLVAAAGTKLAIAIPQHNNKGAQLIAKKMHIPIRFLDPYSENYLETMRTLAMFLENPYSAEK